MIFLVLVLIICTVEANWRAYKWRKSSNKHMEDADRWRVDYGRLKFEVRYLMNNSEAMPDGELHIPKSVMVQDLQWNELMEFWDNGGLN